MDDERAARIERKLDLLIAIVRGFGSRLTELENARTDELRMADTQPAPAPGE